MTSNQLIHKNMLSKILGAALQGIDAIAVEIEFDLGRGGRGGVVSVFGAEGL